VFLDGGMNDFAQGVIGQRYSRTIYGNDTLSADTVIVPSRFLQESKLEIGDQIEMLNFTLRNYYYDEQDNLMIDTYKIIKCF